MSSKRLFIITVLLAGSYAWNSCGESEDVRRDQLIGRWELEQASRNGKPTQSLVDLYFRFEDDGTLETNLSGQVEQGHFELDHETIRQTETTIDANYTIESISDSTLSLRTRLRNMQFQFGLRKEGASK